MDNARHLTPTKSTSPTSPASTSPFPNYLKSPPPTPRLASPSRSGTLALEREIVAIAGDQLGLVTLSQAAEAGVDAQAIRRRVLAGLLIRMFVGVYRLVGVEPTRRQESLAACLAVSDSAICGLSAALIHGLPVGPPSSSKPAKPSLVIPFEQRVFTHGIDVRRTRHLPPTHPWFSGRITTVSATIVDLAGLVGPITLGRCLDHALGERTTTIASVLKIVNERPSSRFTGRAPLIAALDARSDGRLLHRSSKEQGVLRWILAAGLPNPESNLLVDGIEVDFGWPQFKIALEISPFYTHGSELKQQRDAERRRILQKAGWWVIEATDIHLVSALAFAPIIADVRALMSKVA